MECLSKDAAAAGVAAVGDVSINVLRCPAFPAFPASSDIMGRREASRAAAYKKQNTVTASRSLVRVRLFNPWIKE